MFWTYVQLYYENLKSRLLSALLNCYVYFAGISPLGQGCALKASGRNLSRVHGFGPCLLSTTSSQMYGWLVLPQELFRYPLKKVRSCGVLITHILLFVICGAVVLFFNNFIAEFFLYRIVFLVSGIIIMTMASSLSKSLVFYYSSAMAVGIILVILMVLFQVDRKFFFAHIANYSVLILISISQCWCLKATIYQTSWDY